MPAQQRRPIRIANCSGAINDGPDQIYRLAAAPEKIDAITADYLAEFNIAWKAIEQQSHPELGYTENFLDQLAWNNGDGARLAIQKGIKLVNNGGALNPAGLAKKVAAYLDSLGLKARIAWVEGDNITQKLRDGQLGQIPHLDRQGEVFNNSLGELLSANAYVGQAGIVRALEEGADIVICGRCTDASPVMGLASWWHSWQITDLDPLAGSLMAGHLIECGPYVTGGNYCGQWEIPSMIKVGYPIAEIAADGGTVITKPEGTTGAVTVDTCKSQILYEIQGLRYLNGDVIANLDDLQLEEIGKDRVRLSGVRGMKAPPTTKLAVCLFGGWQAEIMNFASGLDADYKFNVLRNQLLAVLNPKDFSTLSIEKYGSSPRDPKSQQECTVAFRLFVQTPKKEAIEDFKRAIFYNGLQGYCGLHVCMDWRTAEPRPYVKYFPGLVKQQDVPLSVHFFGESRVVSVPARKASDCAVSVPKQPVYEPAVPLSSLVGLGNTVNRPLGDIVFSRSGDKGSNANMGFWVRDARAWPWLRSFLTTPKIIELLGQDWKDSYTAERCEFPNLWAVHFVIKGLLQDGVSSSSVLDGFGKSVAEFVRARYVDMPQELVALEDQRRTEAVRKAATTTRL